MDQVKILQKIEEWIQIDDMNKKYRGHIINEVIQIEKILDFIINHGPSSIDTISTQLNMKPNKVRYETLRLVQLNKLEMKAEPNMVEPIFSILCE